MAFAEISLDRLRDDYGYDVATRPGSAGGRVKETRRDRVRFRRSRMSPLPVVTHVPGTAEFRLLLDDGPQLVTPARARELVTAGHARLAVLAAR